MLSRKTRHSLAVLLAAAALGAVVAVRAYTGPRNDFRFSILGDRTGGAAPEIYGRVWREVDLLHPDFVINVGDTIQGGKDDVAEGQWKELQPLWEQYKHYPLYFTPGNHDVFSELSKQIYERYTGRPVNYSFGYEDAHFTVLDNSRGAALSEEQIAFLAEDLEKHKARSPKFIFFHKPYWIALLKLESTDFPLHKLAKKYGVEYIISGHGHQFVRMVRDGVTYMEVGSSGGTIRRGLERGEGFQNGWFYHHVLGRVKGGKVWFTVKEIDGAKGAGRMFKAEDWDEKGPKFPVGDPARASNPQT